MEEHFSEWPTGPGGYPYRRAARVVVVDDRQRILLARGHDIDDARRCWWFTIGGGIEPGEDARAAAVRELYEETGFVATADELAGPVLTRRSLFHFLAKTRRQDEQYFLWRAPSPRLPGGRLTALERRVIDGFEWWDIRQIARRGEGGVTFYPLGLAKLASAWVPRWDGSCPLVAEPPWLADAAAAGGSAKLIHEISDCKE